MPPHDAVATNATATMETTGLARPWEEGATRSMHAQRTHVMSGSVARTGPRTSTGGGTGGGGANQSWRLQGSGGAIIRPLSLAHTRNEQGRGKDGTGDVNRRRHRQRRDNPIVDFPGEQRCNNLTAVVGPCT